MIIKNDQDGINEIVQTLLKDGNACVPTDTVYGLIASSDSFKAVRNLFLMKGRDEQKPLALLVDSIEMVSRYIKITPIIDWLMRDFWPGALTIVCEKSEYALSNKVIEAATGKGNLIGIRIPKSDTVLKIIKNIRAPIFATSVNMTGEESLNDPFLIENDFVKKLGNDIPVLDKSFEKLSFESSTVVKIIGDDLQILRKGKLSDEIMTQYRMKVENF